MVHGNNCPEKYITVERIEEAKKRQTDNRIADLAAQVKQLREALEGILGVSGGLATREDYDRALRVLEATKPDDE